MGNSVTTEQELCLIPYPTKQEAHIVDPHIKMYLGELS